MTQENVGDVSQNQSSESSSGISSSTESYTAPVEKMISQSKVDEIVKSVKYEGNRRLDELRQKYESGSSNNAAPVPAQQANVSKDDVSKMIQGALQNELSTLARQAEEQVQQKQVNELVNNFTSKMDAGKEKYSDFDDVTKNINFGAIPHTVARLTTEIDNGTDVIYELAKNKPMQLMQLESLLSTQPHLARQALRELSESIKVNDKGKQVQHAREPLSQLAQSNVGVDDGSDLSIGDLRKNPPWKR